MFRFKGRNTRRIPIMPSAETNNHLRADREPAVAILQLTATLTVRVASKLELMLELLINHNPK